MARKQLTLIDTANDSQTVQTADRLVELLEEKDEILSKIKVEETQLIALLKRHSRVSIRHGGKTFKLSISPSKEKIVVKTSKTKGTDAVPAQDPAMAPQAVVPSDPPAPPAAEEKRSRRRLVNESLRVKKH